LNLNLTSEISQNEKKPSRSAERSTSAQSVKLRRKAGSSKSRESGDGASNQLSYVKKMARKSKLTSTATTVVYLIDNRFLNKFNPFEHINMSKLAASSKRSFDFHPKSMSSSAANASSSTDQNNNEKIIKLKKRKTSFFSFKRREFFLRIIDFNFFLLF
jgi:hypothetical protein